MLPVRVVAILSHENVKSTAELNKIAYVAIIFAAEGQFPLGVGLYHQAH